MSHATGAEEHSRARGYWVWPPSFRPSPLSRLLASARFLPPSGPKPCPEQVPMGSKPTSWRTKVRHVPTFSASVWRMLLMDHRSIVFSRWALVMFCFERELYADPDGGELVERL